MTRIAFVVDDALYEWAGGYNYVRNLIKAIVASDRPDVEPIIVVPAETKYRYLEDFGGLQVFKTTIVQRSAVLWILRKVIERCSGRDVVFRRFLKLNNVSVLSHSGHLGRFASFPSIGWIPDFQHVRMPEFFSEEEIRSRNRIFSNIISGSCVVILSSHDAKRDFDSFCPSAAAKARVLQFVSPVSLARGHSSRIAGLLTGYGIKRPYFFLPNQFWVHKNHKVVVRAVASLRARGLDPLVVCSGRQGDHRQPHYYDDLVDLIEKTGVANNFIMLGRIPYGDIISLMYESVAVINPSLFEGWSTTLEECKSLGVRIIASDIPVHREQEPNRGIFFNPHDPTDLASKLAYASETKDLKADAEMYDIAQAGLQGRMRDFGLSYVRIVSEALDAIPS